MSSMEAIVEREKAARARMFANKCTYYPEFLAGVVAVQLMIRRPYRTSPRETDDMP